jgi:Ser/Thr protein kinase RdoA (MazF antagonist)
MSSLSTSSASNNLPLPEPLSAGIEWSPAARRHRIAPDRLPVSDTVSERIEMVRHEMETVLRFWAYRPEMWNIVGFTAPGDTLPYAMSPNAHPIVEVVRTRMVVRRQHAGLSEGDAIARHAFMRYLTEHGLPVPALIARDADDGAGGRGSTWAAVPIAPLTDPQHAAGILYAIENAIYELQAYMPGQRFVSDGPHEEARLAAAGRTLGLLHQASFKYPSGEHVWPQDRSMRFLARAYLARIAGAGQDRRTPRRMASELRQLAGLVAKWVAIAEANLLAHRNLPWLMVHGDYQPRNLGFEGDHVVAIYDFDAIHRDWRLAELAYALLTFSGLCWEEQTPVAAEIAAANPPLVERGLDLDRARIFLEAYGSVAPAAPGEAELLADALLLTLPIIFVNGVGDDLIANGSGHTAQPPREWGRRIAWAASFPEWLDAHRSELSDSWRRASAPVH